MKVRVTIMTENDKHRPDQPKEKIEATAMLGWELILKTLLYSEDSTAYVESCELVEE